MVSKQMKKLLLLVFIFLLVLLICFAVISYNKPEFEFITYLSGSSTFIVAILTILYVFTTSKQLDIMTNQLSQMKKDRELQNQPLPYIENIKIVVEKPKCFYSPPEDEFSFQSRYKLEATLNNLSESPAICIDISAFISIPMENDELILESVCQRVDVLEGKRKLEGDDKIHLLYCNDFKGKFFEALRSESAETYPRLNIKTHYRNISGGCFTYVNEYYIIPDNDNEDTIRDWHIQIVSFPTKYKDKLSELKFLSTINSEKWDNLSNEIEGEVACSITSSNDLVELGIVAIDGKFNIQSLERNDYFKNIEGNSYGHFVGVSKNK